MHSNCTFHSFKTFSFLSGVLNVVAISCVLLCMYIFLFFRIYSASPLEIFLKLDRYFLTLPPPYRIMSTPSCSC